MPRAVKPPKAKRSEMVSIYSLDRKQVFLARMLILLPYFISTEYI